jgi:GT2 family glycosyltransferase
MRVLAHIHTFNDSQVIDRALDALRRQTQPLEGIVVVDNASTDGTLDRTFPENVTIIRNPANLGNVGAIRVGFAHALEHGFDWTWVLDPDSVPEPDALENLLAFFQHLPLAEREQVSFLACRLADGGGTSGHYAILLGEDSGIEYLPVEDGKRYCRCDCFLWSGSLFRMPAVAKIGLPSPDYFIDLSELEYGYRARQLGLVGYIVNNGILNHNVGRTPGVTIRTWRFGPFFFPIIEVSPLRSYYYSRNMLYFWLYQCRPQRARWVFRSIVYVLIFTTSFAMRPVSHRRHLIACIRGIRDGLTGRIERRY